MGPQKPKTEGLTGGGWLEEPGREGTGSHLLHTYLGEGVARRVLHLSHRGVPKGQLEWHPPWSLSQLPASSQIVLPHPSANVYSQAFSSGPVFICKGIIVEDIASLPWSPFLARLESSAHLRPSLEGPTGLKFQGQELASPGKACPFSDTLVHMATLPSPATPTAHPFQAKSPTQSYPESWARPGRADPL